jgi:hypothetical protein
MSLAVDGQGRHHRCCIGVDGNGPAVTMVPYGMHRCERRLEEGVHQASQVASLTVEAKLWAWIYRLPFMVFLVFAACSSGEKEPLYAGCPEGWVVVGPGECDPGESVDDSGDSGQRDGGDSAQTDSGGDDTDGGDPDSGDSASPGRDSGEGDSAHGAGDTGEALCARPISEEDLSVYRAYFPDVACGSAVAIPEAHLWSEDEEYGNVDLLLFFGSDGALLGQARRIFTPIYCTADVCEAVVFRLVYEADTTFLDLLQGDGLLFLLKKYWEDRYETFSEEDMALVKTQLAAPPSILLAAPDTSSLVEGTHGTAPTLLEYQPYVVRGAAFTCYIVLQYSVSTQSALAEVLATVKSGGVR